MSHGARAFSGGWTLQLILFLGAMVMMHVGAGELARAQEQATAKVTPSVDSLDESWRFPTIAIVRMTAPKVDGQLDEGEWAQATLLPALLSRNPLDADGLPPSQKTSLWLGYDDEALYLAVRQELPSEERPVLAKAPRRDTHENNDTSLQWMFSTRPGLKEQFNISINANSLLYDRRFDDGSAKFWNPNLTVVSSATDFGWQGELKIPFKELGFDGPPAVGSVWTGYFYNAWKRTGSRLYAWPYVRWRSKVEDGQFVFAGDAPAIRFDQPGRVSVAGAKDGEVRVDTALYRKKASSGAMQSFLLAVANAVADSQVEGGTFASLEDILKSNLEEFEVVSKLDGPGEYLLRYHVMRGEQLLAYGAQPYYEAPPVSMTVTPHFLVAQKLFVEVQTRDEAGSSVEVELQPVGWKVSGPLKSRKAELALPIVGLEPGSYTVRATVMDEQGSLLTTDERPLIRPELPSWWTNRYGLTPVVPPPWTPVKADADTLHVLGRQYHMRGRVFPQQIDNLGQSMLASPITLRTSGPWDGGETAELVDHDEESATYRATYKRGGAELRVTNRVEFDGMMLVDVELAGQGTFDTLELVVPVKSEFAQLMQNYREIPGPYTSQPRAFGLIPEKGYSSIPFLTTWMGTDELGIEWSAQTAKDWSLLKPEKAIEIQREGEVTRLVVRFISKAVALSEQPRRYRFGLVATPVKTILPHVQKARLYDDVRVALQPSAWSGHFVWHPPMLDAQQIEKTRAWVDSVHAQGQKLLVNGGWAASVQDPDSMPWVPEMFSHPLTNASFGRGKQYSHSWNSPFGEFMVNSFGHNAKVAGFDGIRFDTVLPWKPDASLINGSGWLDDQGNLWPSYNIFAQREVWKRLYRIFHGEVIEEGIIYTPVAAGPIMAVHAFSDVREIGEGFYQTAPTLKEGYPSDMVRAMLAGKPYGERAVANLKAGPLFYNPRIAALLVHNAEPRFQPRYTAGYAAHAIPSTLIEDAWAWVDRFNAQWHPAWKNGRYLKIEKPASGQDAMVMGSFLLNPSTHRLLLIVTNYEQQPMRVGVTIDLPALGLSGQMHAVDAITSQPLPLDDQGRMMLDLLNQRYRLIQISRHPSPQAGDNLLVEVPGVIQDAWQSSPVMLEPGSLYAISAEYQIDATLGENDPRPNFMDKFSPAINHSIALKPEGDGIIPLPMGMTMKDATQRVWEPTPGWTTYYTTFRTSDAPGPVRVMLVRDGVGSFAMRKIELRRITHNDE